MTPLELARQAKARKDAERRAEYKVAVARYLEWSRHEAILFKHRAAVSLTLGRACPMFIAADIAWLAHWRERPTPPPDHSEAWELAERSA